MVSSAPAGWLKLRNIPTDRATGCVSGGNIAEARVSQALEI
jgi:hypothetical protein